MPRIGTSPVSKPPGPSGDPLSMPPQHPNVLKRNQACHQCRRRKLKCDAKRPCSTCVRSHAHALSHASPGANISPHPDCTFDEKPAPAVTEAPKNKYERLENRISELESLLRQKDHALMHSAQSRLSPTDGHHQYHDSLHDFGDYMAGSSYNNGSTSGRTNNGLVSASPTVSLVDSGQGASPPVSQDLMWPNWPQDLPEPPLLKHLIEVFFVFHPHASRLFHFPTFMSSLALSPSHPKFPASPVLHAICAIGSLYTAAVTSPPLPDFDEVPPDEIFLERLRVKEQRPDSFAEQHAKLARESAERMNTLGEKLFEVFQAQIILSWFYWSHGRWVDIFLGSAHTMRLSVPLGLNMCPPFHSISKSERPPSILPPARSVVEDEMRRNAFWLAYAIERQHGCGNMWANSLDDQDISQLLPVRGDQFDEGVLVPPLERQWAHARDVLLTHPPETTDSFTLYVKGTILISRIKNFNMRFRAKHYAGDSSVATQPDEHSVYDPVDPRGSPAFQELDHLVTSFSRSNFPEHLKNPIVNGIVDNHLYAAFLLPHVATIILHDPHAEVAQSGCISALKILTASRAILDLVYDVTNTSFDITLLDSSCLLCWFLAGRILVRFLQAALNTQNTDQIVTFRTEIEFIYNSIAKVGQRIPLAHRFARMLQDILRKTGPVDSIPIDYNSFKATRGTGTRMYDQLNDYDLYTQKQLCYQAVG